jgi:bla regulator protein blaR1
MKLSIAAALLAAYLLPGAHAFGQQTPAQAGDTLPHARSAQSGDDDREWDRSQRALARAQHEVVEAQREAVIAQRAVQRSLMETQREVQRSVEEARREAQRSLGEAQREVQRSSGEAQRNAEEAQRAAHVGVLQAQREIAMVQRETTLARSEGMREAAMAQREAMLAIRQGQLARANEQVAVFRDMMEEMAKDHLIQRGKDTQIEYRDGNLFIDGKEQPSQIRDKYKHYFNEKNQSLRLNLGQGIAI